MLLSNIAITEGGKKTSVANLEGGRKTSVANHSAVDEGGKKTSVANHSAVVGGKKTSVANHSAIVGGKKMSVANHSAVVGGEKNVAHHSAVVVHFVVHAFFPHRHQKSKKKRSVCVKIGFRLAGQTAGQKLQHRDFFEHTVICKCHQ